MSRSIRQAVIDPDDDETILHLRGPILNAMVLNTSLSSVIYLFAYYDEDAAETLTIIRTYEPGQTIPDHFKYVDTVSVGNRVYHICSYREDEDEWTPASMSDVDALSVSTSEASNS